MNHRRTRLGICAALLPAISCALHAHPVSSPLSPDEIWTAWSFDPVVVAGLLLSAWLYWRGVRAIRRSAERGMRSWEILSFWLGWLSLVIAFVSPLHPAGEVLFSAHMIQHEVMMVVSAPLLVLGRPLIPLLWGLPIAWRRALGGWANRRPVRGVWRVLSGSFVAWGLHAVALWVWHAPPLFQATLANEWIHTCQHLSFLGSALLFCWALLHARSGGRGVLYVFTTALHTSILGALLTFAPTVWYPVYRETTGAWGLTPLEDQQVGGLIMWVPAGIFYLIAGLALFAGWMREGRSGVPQPDGVMP